VPIVVVADAPDIPPLPAALLLPRRRPWWRSRAETPAAEPGDPPPSGPAPDAECEVTEREIAAAAAAMERAAVAGPTPALLALAERLGLSRFERDTLLLCVAVELDPSIAELCALAQGDARMPYPTFGLALALLPDPAWDVVSPQRPLRYWRLIDVRQHGGQTLVGSVLRADERILSFVKGLNYLDDRLDTLVAPLDTGTGAGIDLPASQQAVINEITRHWAASGGAGPVIQLVGADEAGKQLVAAQAAAACGLVAHRLPASLLSTQPGDLDDLARLWQREALLLPLALYVDAEDAGDAGDVRAAARRLLEQVHTPAFVGVRESGADLGRRSLVLDVAPPTVPERAAAWRAALGDGAEESVIGALAGQFALDVAAIHDIAGLAAADGSEEVWRACRIRTRPRLAALAQRLEPKFGWDDIVLPDDVRTLLHQITSQVAHRPTVYNAWGFGEKSSRGLGVAALFAGPSGVGKTMAAEVIANHLRLDLYCIDLSQVVSKYIGETEKNLRRLFDAAETGGSILFFDEADALFGRRTEVKDSHDRYANIEVNYLLQRMESYRGLAILATNMRTALDQAFLRRLRFIVQFTFPDVAQRRAIWEKAFPAQAPLCDLDYDRLARLQMSGAMTRNIAINAAFLAADAGTPITMPLVLEAARTEFRKLELPIRERDFTWDQRTEPAS
jgi:ATPase family protein associated with various cellular activities (AAA)/winged helix domain-containing protein